MSSDKENSKVEFITAKWTPAFDFRFPTTNQSRNCWAHYVIFQRCRLANGEDSPLCAKPKAVYSEICPKFWTDQWDEWRDEGRFPGQIQWRDLLKASQEDEE